MPKQGWRLAIGDKGIYFNSLSFLGNCFGGGGDPLGHLVIWWPERTRTQNILKRSEAKKIIKRSEAIPGKDAQWCRPGNLTCLLTEAASLYASLSWA